MNVGEYIKQLRNKNGYSQEQLGRLVGVQRAAVQKWECGKVQNLKRETITKLAEVFNVSPASFFMGWEEDQARPSESDKQLDDIMDTLKGFSNGQLEMAINYINYLKSSKGKKD